MHLNSRKKAETPTLVCFIINTPDRLGQFIKGEKKSIPWTESFGESHSLAQINRVHSFAFTPDTFMIYDRNKINLSSPPPWFRLGPPVYSFATNPSLVI